MFCPGVFNYRFLFSELCLKIFVLVNFELFLSTWAEFLQPCSKHHIFLFCLAYGLMDIFYTPGHLVVFDDCHHCYFTMYQ